MNPARESMGAPVLPTGKSPVDFTPSAENAFERLNAIPGTIVSAALDTIQIFPFAGRLRNLAITVAEAHPWISAWRKMGIPVFHPEPDAYASDPSSADDDDHEDTDDNNGNSESGSIGIPSQTPISTARFLLAPDTLQFMKSLPAPIRVLMFKPDAASMLALEKHGIDIIGGDPGLARRLENKLLFPSVAARANIPIPSHQIVSLDSSVHSAPMPFPFIVQFAKGFSGNRTFLVQSGDDWAYLATRFSNRRCRVSRYIPGETWTANAVVMPKGHVVVSEPFLQETRIFYSGGLPARIGSRGNVWGKYSPSIKQGVDSAMLRLGRELFRFGFKGFFGADLLVPETGEDILAVEINPRITASAAMLTALEMAAGAVPIVAYHLAVSLGVSLSPVSGQRLPPGGQWIFRTDTPLTGKLAGMVPGTYRLTQGTEETVPAPIRQTDESPTTLADGECLLWKPERASASTERLRIIYRGDCDRFYRFLTAITGEPAAESISSRDGLRVP
ncbi:ATP-grasp domain-containing protein [bacterium]|nr:ATP-grasp domain-containing protein [candidate division CSSED10-310 bacterium]